MFSVFILASSISCATFCNGQSDAGDDGDVYRVCVANDMNRLVTKTVQLDVRSSSKGAAVKRDKPVKLITNPDQLTEEERKEVAAKEQEVRTPQVYFLCSHLIEIFI